MKFDIARQPLVPAFITLLALCVAAMCCVEGHQLPTEAVGGAQSHATLPMAVPPPGLLIAQFQTAYPVWSRVIAGMMILFTGMCIGRMTLRNNLYAVNSCLPIPLYAIIACGVALGGEYLTGFTIATSLTLSLKNFARAFCSGYGFDGIFRAGLYLGLGIVIAPVMLPLLLLLPLGLLLFGRTLREAVVGLLGLLLAPLIFCYVNWGAGGAFQAPLLHAVTAFVEGTPLGLFAITPLPKLILLGGVVVLDLFAFFFFLSDLHTVGTKQRFILFFNIGVLLLTTSLLFAPSATPSTIALLAVPSAILLPLFFVRIHRLPALLLYLLLMISGIYCILQ